ncbi:MAG: PH domain-containing protein [Actinobacteria bacterium]|nr:PH domain-containing protein [Actinomycetota bacterium]
MNETFRPRSNFAWAGTSIVLIALFGANSLWVSESVSQKIFELAICGALIALVYIFWLRPKLVLRSDTVEIVNPLRTELIAYTDILDLETKWSLAIIHTGGKSRVWVAPASGKQRWVADKKFGWFGGSVPLTDSKNAGMESMSASLDSLSGQAAYMIRERIKRLH